MIASGGAGTLEHLAEVLDEGGASAVLGGAVFDRQHHFRLHIGPVGAATFESLQLEVLRAAGDGAVDLQVAGADACRAIGDLFGVGFGRGQQGRQIGELAVGGHHDQKGEIRDGADHLEVLHRAVSQVVVKRPRHCVPTRGQEQGVAIWLGFDHHVDTNVATSTQFVFNDHGLPQQFPHLLTQSACQQICATTCGHRHDDLYGFVWKVLRKSVADQA